jgi:hypothetical protein
VITGGEPSFGNGIDAVDGFSHHRGLSQNAGATSLPSGDVAPDPETGKPWPREVAGPWLADFGLVECPEPGIRSRMIANAHDSDGTLWIGVSAL